MQREKRGGRDGERAEKKRKEWSFDMNIVPVRKPPVP